MSSKYGADGFSGDRRLDVQRQASILSWIMSTGPRPDPLSPDEFALTVFLAVSEKEKFLGLLDRYWRDMGPQHVQSLQDLADYQRWDRRFDWAFLLDAVANGIKEHALSNRGSGESWQRFMRLLLNWLPTYLGAIPNPPGNDNRAVFPRLIACESVEEFAKMALGESTARHPGKARLMLNLRHATELSTASLPVKMALLFETAVVQLALWDKGLGHELGMPVPCVRPVEMMIESARQGDKHDLFDCTFLGWTAVAHTINFCNGLQPSHLQLMAEVISDDMGMLKDHTDSRLRSDAGQAGLMALGAFNILYCVLSARVETDRRTRTEFVSQARQAAKSLDSWKDGGFGFVAWLDNCLGRANLKSRWPF